MVDRDATGRDGIVRPIEWTPLRALAVVLGATTSAIHFYVGATTGQHQFVVLGVGLLSGAVVFFTRFWERVLYLIGAIYVAVLLSVWVLADMPRFLLGAVDAVVQVALIATFFYLFAANAGSAADGS